jgi:hypothetical protein
MRRKYGSAERLHREVKHNHLRHKQFQAESVQDDLQSAQSSGSSFAGEMLTPSTSRKYTKSAGKRRTQYPSGALPQLTPRRASECPPVREPRGRPRYTER